MAKREDRQLVAPKSNHFHEPTDATRALVLHRARLGLPQKMIAAQIGISPSTLTRHYPDELERGSADGIEKVAGALQQLALGDPANGVPPHPASCMFIMKCRAGWRETNRTEITGPDGNPLITAGAVESEGPSYEDYSVEDLLMIEEIEKRAALRGDTGER
jgi:hypothetical protein